MLHYNMSMSHPTPPASVNSLAREPSLHGPTHDDAHGHAHGRAHPTIAPSALSLLAQSAPNRLLAVSLIVATLWAAVFWATH